MYPLNKSRANVVIARNLFPVLSTFVVPILPEPTVLISFFRNILLRVIQMVLIPKDMSKLLQ